MIIKVSNKGYKVKPDKDRMFCEIAPSLKKSNNVSVTIPTLATYLERGFSVVLAEFKEKGNIDRENIKKIELIAIDIDSKENPITMLEMKALVFSKIGIIPCIEYRTFSDTDFTKFRLIYKLDQPIDGEVYELLYKALKWKLGKYIDSQTSNANRIWAGTNKKVRINYDNVDFDFQKMMKLINNYKKAMERKTTKKKEVTSQIIKGNNEELEGRYIKKEYKEEIAEMLIESIDLTEFLDKHFGLVKGRGGNYKCPFPDHAGNGDGYNFGIKGNVYRCFSHCGGGNVITAAKKIYNTEDFSLLCFSLAKEYNIYIDEKMLGVLRNE